jgi:hypothetical protein
MGEGKFNPHLSGSNLPAEMEKVHATLSLFLWKSLVM